MTSPTYNLVMPDSPEQLSAMLSDVFAQGMATADATPPATRFDQGYWTCGMEVLERLVESYGMSHMAYKQSNPEADFDAGPFHHAQALAYQTIALTILVHEMESTPEDAILRFERMYYALGQLRAGVPGELTTIFLYEPTGLCTGSAERTEHDADCGCGGEHGGDTLEVADTDILHHLRASYDRVQEANMNGDRPEHRMAPVGGAGPFA